jgi:23S rRNA (adenine-N6)-dimethyltransferase
MRGDHGHSATAGPPGPAGPRTERDVRRRTLSQNFLSGSLAVSAYLDAVELGTDCLVLEVGAGDGTLTEALAPKCRELIAYELDPVLARRLRTRVGGITGVRVVEGDFLAARPPRQRFQVVGNVPFSLTSKIVDWCLGAAALTSATVITQLEYAKKRSGAYGRWSLLTVRTWPVFSWELRGRIPRTQFRPVPRVDAGILHLARRSAPLIPQAKAGSYARIVELGFSGVGGTLYSSLIRRYDPSRAAAAFRAAGVDRDTVVAFVNPDAWLRIFEALDHDGPGPGRRGGPQD